jgi:crossover junction endodeoxyribonuclease RusA
MILTFSLPFPPSQNSAYRNVPGRGRAYTLAAKTWLTNAAVALAEQRVRGVKGPVKISYRIGRPDKRRRDISNLVKVMEDCLVKNGVIEDDSLVEAFAISWDQDVTGAEVKIITCEAQRVTP